MRQYTVDLGFSTRKKFYSVLLEAPEILSAKSLGVASICSVAGASRSTFYRHFDDVDGFLSRFLDDVLADTLMSNPFHLSFYQAMTLQCSKVVKDESLRACLLAPGLSQRFEDIALTRMRSRIGELVKDAPPEQERELGFLADAVSRNLPPLFFRWMNRRDGMGTAQFAACLTSALTEPLRTYVSEMYL